MAAHPTYMGPKMQVQPEEADRLEATCLYAAEEKNDGHWCEATTDEEGTVVSLRGRSGKAFTNSNVEGLLGLRTHLPDTVLVGELEAGTEAATTKFDSFGIRRIHVFDAVQVLGRSVVDLPYERRRDLLEMALVCSKDESFTSRVRLTRRVTEGFSEFHRRVVEEGGEGLVLKKLGRPYRPHGASGKTDDWVKMKRHRFVDYVVVGVGKSAGGSDNLQVGLFIEGTLQRVCGIKQPPSHLNLHELVGRVIECRGAEVHSSGALRHGHFERVREDKNIEDCTLNAALSAA